MAEARRRRIDQGRKQHQSCICPGIYDLAWRRGLPHPSPGEGYGLSLRRKLSNHHDSLPRNHHRGSLPYKGRSTTGIYQWTPTKLDSQHARNLPDRSSFECGDGQVPLSNRRTLLDQLQNCTRKVQCRYRSVVRWVAHDQGSGNE